jgi:hypothetical protein
MQFEFWQAEETQFSIMAVSDLISYTSSDRLCAIQDLGTREDATRILG